MAGITVTARSRLKRQAAALGRAMEDIVGDMAREMRDDARESMTTPKSGRLYPGGHVASAPGEAPAIRPFPFYATGGELYASIYAAHTGADEWTVWTDLEYARYLEYGTSKMRPRPFFRPAARRVATKYRKEAGLIVNYALSHA